MDRSAKILLGLIAAGLWANAILPVLKIIPAQAQSADHYLQRIDSNISLLVNGVCVNRKLCG